MIYNFYTYLFVSALSASAAAAIFLRTLINNDRRKIWDISSVSFLLFLIISLIVFFAGLIIVDSEKISLIEPLIFFLICFVVSTVLFFFMRAIYLFLILLLLIGSAFFYQNRLIAFKAFSDSNNFAIKTLQIQEKFISLEIVDFYNEVDFQSYEEKTLYPVFLILDFPEYIFFLENPSYINFAGFVFDSKELPGQIEADFRKSAASGLPFSRIRLYTPQLLGLGIYSTFKLNLKHDGTLDFDIQN